MFSPAADDLGQLRNIGPTVKLRLAEIGVHTRTDLQRLGAPAAYKRLSLRYSGKHLPVCYYLYSLQGALEGRNWRELSDLEKLNLRNSIER